MRYDLSIIKKIIHTCFWIDDIDVLKENIKSSKRRKMIDIFDLSLCRCGLFDRRYTILSLQDRICRVLGWLIITKKTGFNNVLLFTKPPLQKSKCTCFGLHQDSALLRIRYLLGGYVQEQQAHKQLKQMSDCLIITFQDAI